MKFKKLFLAPIFILFASPWIHIIAYLNLMIACPHLSNHEAQMYTLLLTITTLIISVFYFLLIILSDA